MAGFKVNTFKGTTPKITPRLLPDSSAQVAKNCFVASGDLEAYKATTDDWTAVAKTGTIQSIHKFQRGVSNTDPNPPVSQGFWFHWNEDVDVVRGPIPNDTTERTYYTGHVNPKVTNRTLALAGSSTAYPATSYQLGVPYPTNAPTVVSTEGTATSTDPLDQETRYYIYTFVTDFGEESAPSDPSAKITLFPGESMKMNFASVATGNYNITHKRVYRTATGTSGTDYQFVADITHATTVYHDQVAAEDLGEVNPTKTWLPPDTGMIGLKMMPNGIFVGFKGNTVMFSEPYIPYAWPVEYQLTIEYDIVGIGVAGNSVIVCTTGTPYVITGATPQAMSVTKTNIEQACVSKRSIVDIGAGSVYASPDGLVLLSSSGSELLTSQLLTRDQWQALQPSTMHGYYHDNRIYMFYGTAGGFILDPEEKHLVLIDTYATAGFKDLEDDHLYLMVGGDIVKWDSHATNKLTYVWKSKVFMAGRPQNMGVAQVRASAYPVTLKLYADSVLKHTQTVASLDPFRLPSGYRADEWEIEVTSTNTIKEIMVAESMEDLKNV